MKHIEFSALYKIADRSKKRCDELKEKRSRINRQLRRFQTQCHLDFSRFIIHRILKGFPMINGHVFIATSLDGFIARMNGDIEWLISRDDPKEDHGYNDFIKGIDGIVMGRGTFEKALTFETWYYSVPVIVLSKTLTASNIPEHLKDKVQISKLSPRELMSQLEKKGWKNVYVDGGQVIQSFLREGQIADLVITTVPVLIGEGRPLFGSLLEDISLTHIQTRAFPSGLVQSEYKVTR